MSGASRRGSFHSGLTVAGNGTKLSVERGGGQGNRRGCARAAFGAVPSGGRWRETGYVTDAESAPLPIRAAHYEVRPALDHDGLLHLHAARYSATLSPRERERLSTGEYGLTLLGIAPPPWGTPEAVVWSGNREDALNASVVVTHAAGRPSPETVLGEVMQEYPGCLIGAVVTGQDRCLVSVHTHKWNPDDSLPALRMTVTGPYDRPAAPELYPLAVYGWIRWWANREEAAGRGFRRVDLPCPPAELVFVDAFTQEPTPLTVSKARATVWPALPPRVAPFSWIDDRDLL